MKTFIQRLDEMRLGAAGASPGKLEERLEEILKIVRALRRDPGKTVEFINLIENTATGARDRFLGRNFL